MSDRPEPLVGEPAATAVRRAVAPFRHTAYRRLALALILQTLAAGMWAVSVVWEVIRLGGGPGALSIVATAGAIGVILPALLGGVVADRVPQKTILLVVTTVELVGMLGVAVLAATGHTSITVLAAVGLLIGLAMAFYYPAYTAWLPALVEESDLMAVNGFEGMVRPTLHQALGPALAGSIIAAVNPALAMSVCAAVSLGGVLALFTVPKTAVRRDLSQGSGAAGVAGAWQDMREGFRFMVRTPWLLATLLFASVLVLAIMGPIEVLVPFLIKDRLGGGPQDHAWVLAAYGLGSAVGSLVMGSMRMPRRYLTVMNVLWGAGAIPLALMGVSRELWQVVAAAAVLGVAFGMGTVIWGTLLQRRVPPELLGRVSSLDFFVSLALLPVSMALAGPVSHWLGLTATFVIAGLLPVVVAVVAILAARLPEDELRHPLS